MAFLLDSNAVIAMLRDPSSGPGVRARRERVGDVAMSSIVAHELFYGAFKSSRATRNVALVDALRFPIIEFDREDARKAGEIRALLAGKGLAIGPYDVLMPAGRLSRPDSRNA